MLGGGGKSLVRGTAGSTRVGEATEFLGKSISGRENDAKASRCKKGLVWLGRKEEPSWQEMGPEVGRRGRLRGSLAPREVFAAQCEERVGLGLRSHSLWRTWGKDGVGHLLRRSRIHGREASVVTWMKKGSV